MRARVAAQIAAPILGALGLVAAIVANAGFAAPTPDAEPPSITAARRAIASDPLDIAALRSLGLAWNRQGRTATADAVLSFVATRTWRDVATLAWLIPRRIAQGDDRNALAQTDALMRLDIDNALREPLIKLAIAAAGDERARPALVERLAQKPWWRASFMPRLAQAGEVGGVRATFAALALSAAPATPVEATGLIDRLIAANDFAGARDVWAGVTGRARASSIEARDTAFFTASPDPTAFGWRPASGVGALSAVEAAPSGRAGLALRVDYDGFSAPALPRRLLVLSPGRYRLSWDERRERGEARRLDWALRCVDDVAASAPFAAGPADGDWRTVTRAVAIPASGCAGQWLTLVASPGKRRDPARIWYTRLVVRPADRNAP